MDHHSVNRLAATAALARYDLPPDSRLRAIRATNNAVFEVAAQDRQDTAHRYVLRVHRPRYRSLAGSDRRPSTGWARRWHGCTP